MKIAQVSPYDHQTPGGVREHVIYLTAALTALGHEVKILAPASKRQNLPTNVICVSDRVVPLRVNGSTVRITPSLRAFREIKRILQEERFDVVHIHEPLVPALSLFALLQSKGVTVGHFHGYRERYVLYEWGGRLLRHMIDQLDGRAAVSATAQRGAERYFPGKYEIIPDGVDTERFGNPSLLPIGRFTDGKLNILFVGRMDPRKGLPYLFQAFPLIKSAVSEARLIVVGAFSREEKKPWVLEAWRNGWRDIHFVGYVSPEEIPRYYHTAHVFCAPSTGSEALGIVLLEALASGTPVVASDIEGYRTALTHGREGLLVQPADPTKLAEAIVHLLRDPDLRRSMGQRGRLTAQQYAWPVVAQRTLEMYEACIARRLRHARVSLRPECAPHSDPAV